MSWTQSVHLPLNIPGRLERLPVTRFTWRVILLSGLAWFIESLSIGSLGVVLQPLKQVMHLNPNQVGMLTATSTLGIVIGLIPAGFLADKLGRKKILVWGIIEYSLFTLLCGFSVNYVMLLSLRFLSGFGMGAVFPLPYAIVSEFVSSRKRTLFNGVMDASLSVGYFIAPLLGFVILPNLPIQISWRVFFVIASLPVLYAGLIHKMLPESPRWLERKGRVAEAEAVMSEIERSIEKMTSNQLRPVTPAAAAETSTEPVKGIRAPWSRPFLRRTISRSIAATGTFFMFYIVMTYMPTIFHSKGLTFADSLLFTAIITGAAIPGKLLNGYLAELWGRKTTYVLFMGIAGAGALFFGLADTGPAMIIYACVMSFFGTGAFPGLKMSYAEQYPTPIRTTGAATVETIGRLLGGVAGSYFVPILLSIGGIAAGFYIVASVTIIASLVELLFSPETNQSTLEELEAKTAV